jgi:hypothetical protein
MGGNIFRKNRAYLETEYLFDNASGYYLYFIKMEKLKLKKNDSF